MAALYAGGVHCLNGAVNNSTISGNSALNSGGGVFFDSGSSIVINSTICGNSAGVGGGVYFYNINSGVVTNSIIYFNTAESDTNYNYSTRFSYSCSPGLSGNGNITADPQFVNASAANYHLRPSSPCIDVGINSAAPMPYDLDGKDRIIYGTVDMGAYENLFLIDITNEAAQVTYDVTSYTIGGTNIEEAVGTMNWTNSLTGDGGTLAATQAWTISDITLNVGSNIISVSATNSAGWSGYDSVIITRQTEPMPFIDITNAPANITYGETGADIAGTNLNIAGDLGWIDDSETGTTNWFSRSGNAWSGTVTGLEEGANTITVVGTNIYGHATNDSVTITRQTFAEVAPIIAITSAPANIAFGETTADISGTNLNIGDDLGWIDNSEISITNWFSRSGNAWSVTVTNLEEGANTITVVGTNIYGHATIDSVTIMRQTFAEALPVIKITNSNTTVTYTVNSYTIGGTNNANVVGGMSWTNSLTGETGTFQPSLLTFQFSLLNLGVGDNLISVSGTNIYGRSTNDVVSIQRKTLIESQPQIFTNALIFPSAGSVILAQLPTNIIWLLDKITDDIDGTNLNITKISVHLAETTNEVATVTNNINNLLGEIPWLVPGSLWGGDTNYVLKFEVVDSSSLTNSRIFWDNKFTIVPEPGIIIGYLLSLIGLFIFRSRK